MKKYRNNNGFALITVLILGFAIMLISSAIFLINKNDFSATSAEYKYNIAENAADYGIKYFADGYNTNISPFANNNCVCSNNYCKCTIKPNPNSNNPEAVVDIIYTNNTFIIHSTGIYNGSKVVKVASINTVLKNIPNNNINAISNMAAVMMSNITNISMSGSSSITACDNTCQAAAIIDGNSLPSGQSVDLSQCQNNNNGVASNSGSAILIENGQNGSPQLTANQIYSNYFNNIQSNSDLMNQIQNLYSVKFNSSGTPSGISSNNPITITDSQSSLPSNDSSYDSCNFNQINNVYAQDSTISANPTITANPWNIANINCQATPNFNWDGTKYNAQISFSGCQNPPAAINFSCNKIDFGQNAQVNISNFSGGGAIAGGMIDIADNNVTIKGPPLTLIGENQINITVNNVEINSPVNMFSQNYDINANNLEINSSSILASLGSNSNLNILLNGHGSLGTTDNPMLIISSNNINLQSNGNNSINGLIFSTANNNNFSLDVSGNCNINGSIGSASNSNNNINMSGNSSINYNSAVLNNLSNNLNQLVNSPNCGSMVNAPVGTISNSIYDLNYKTSSQTVY